MKHEPRILFRYSKTMVMKGDVYGWDIDNHAWRFLGPEGTVRRLDVRDHAVIWPLPFFVAAMIPTCLLMAGWLDYNTGGQLPIVWWPNAVELMAFGWLMVMLGTWCKGHNW